MKKIAYLTLLLSTTQAFAQDTTTTKISGDKDSKEKTFSYSIGINYASNKTYKGELATPQKQAYISPYLTIASKWGVFVNADAYNFLNDSVHWDQADLGIGYATKVFDKYKLSASYTHSFFNKNSEQINSGLTDNIDFYVKLPLLKVLRTKLAFDYSYGDTTDFSITWQNSWPIYWDDTFSKDDELALIPKLYIYLGTQNFYSILYRKKPFIQNAEKLAKLQKKNLQERSRFTLTGIYFTLPLSYTKGIMYYELAPNINFTTHQAYLPKDQRVPPDFYISFTIGADF